VRSRRKSFEPCAPFPIALSIFVHFEYIYYF
jgi:hypothetical protein